MLDYFFIIFSFIVTIGSGLWVMGGTSTTSPPMVEIQSTEGTFLYPLSENRDISVKGPAGITQIRIEKGEAFAVDSPGPQRIIMQMGKIHKKNEWIASLPNKVFVRIVSGPQSDIDAGIF